MEIFAGLSVALLVLVALFIAIKTVALWKRTRRLPELLLSGMLVCATVLGYPLSVATHEIPPNEMPSIHAAAPFVTSLGFLCLLLFTLTVFRPGVLWAKALVATCTLWMIGGSSAFAFMAYSGSALSVSQQADLTIGTSIPIGTAYVWTAIESLGYRRMLMRRMALGLAEAAVVDRFWLWAMMCLSAFAAVLTNCTATLLGYSLSAAVIVICSALGLVHAVCMFAAFHPPAWYKAWVERRYAHAQAA